MYVSVFHSGFDKATEQWVSFIRTALEFRMELYAHIERKICQLYRFDQFVVR